MLNRIGNTTDLGALTVDAGTGGTISLKADVETTETVTFQNTSELDLASSVDITASGTSDILASTGVTAIDFSGTGTNVLTATGGDINLAEVGDTANVTELQLIGENVTLAAVTLDNGGTPNLNIDLDGAADDGVKTLTINGAIDVSTLTVDGVGSDDTITLSNNVTVDTNLDLQTNVSSITLAANSVIDVGAGGVDQSLSLADITGDFDLDVTGDTASAISLKSVDANSLDVTGTLTLNDNVTVDANLDLDTNVASITLAASSVIDVAAGGADQAITLADVTGDFDLTLTGDSASAVGLNAVDVDALAVTGTLTLNDNITLDDSCLLYTSPSPRDS